MKKTLNEAHQDGFSLIELLIVVGIIALLILFVVFSIDPLKRFADARNSRRWADANNILSAVDTYMVDNNGFFPVGLDTNTPITELGSCGDCINLSGPLAPHLKYIPRDPISGTIINTNYSIEVNEDNIVTVYATNAENSVDIQVSR
jgi:prepilin-type N-terminal cleavage/methylation domain-containing protein